jgi:hypothetical protein
MGRLADKNILITGGNSGIGLATNIARLQEVALLEGRLCHPRHFMALNGQSARNFMRARATFSFGWWRPSTD